MSLQLAPSVGSSSASVEYNGHGGSGPHQTNSHHAESANVRQQDELHDLEHEKDLDNYQEGSLQMLHIGGSGYWRKGHAVHEQGDEKAMQREIDDLKKQLCRAQRK